MSEAPKEIWCSMGLYYDYKKELEAENKRLRLEAAHADDTADAAIERMKEMEAKLAKAVEALVKMVGKRYYADDPWEIASATLAKLKEQDDE
jgi:hypothetical protein